MGVAHCYHGAEVTFTSSTPRKTVDLEWYSIHIQKHGPGSIGTKLRDYAKIG